MKNGERKIFTHLPIAAYIICVNKLRSHLLNFTQGLNFKILIIFYLLLFFLKNEFYLKILFFIVPIL
jgi:hypothetical protein